MDSVKPQAWRSQQNPFPMHFFFHMTQSLSLPPEGKLYVGSSHIFNT